MGSRMRRSHSSRRTPMLTADARKAYLKDIHTEYCAATKTGKGRILDEARKRTGLHRKVLIRLLSPAHAFVPRPRKRRARVSDGDVTASFGARLGALRIPLRPAAHPHPPSGNGKTPPKRISLLCRRDRPASSGDLVSSGRPVAAEGEGHPSPLPPPVPAGASAPAPGHPGEDAGRMEPRGAGEPPTRLCLP